MKALCDTNIILDVLLAREPFVKASAEVLHLCEKREINGFTTASCITDIFYIVRKYLHDIERTYQAIEKILEIIHVCGVTSADIQEALLRRASDFEDCLAATCARSIHCDCIITRDVKGFADLGIPTFTPEEVLQKQLNLCNSTNVRKDE